ncbi:MAG: ATP-binding protein [Elusimicrobiota bacterium]|jgi:hypothetical protein|nr:ATP-binding protein [Elusimicrobiota bacterium]
MNPLSLGLDSFKHLIDDKSIYIDKTMFLYEILKRYKPYFLSRPRRFGKTLLVDTLYNILKGNKELFNGLWIYDADYNWKRYPVINLSLASINDESITTVKEGLINKLLTIANLEKIALRGTNYVDIFEALIVDLNVKYNLPVAILIDEYDAPIVKQIEELSLAIEMQNTLKRFYAVLKAVNDQRGFIFITGVSKFAQTSIFSALNNLEDITLSPKYSTICGITEAELDRLYPQYMQNMLDSLKNDKAMKPEATISDLKELIFQWYDGYSWDGVTSVLNPWSILNMFNTNFFGDYWSRTGGVPSFLVNLIRSGMVDVMEFKDLETINDTLNIIQLGNELESIPILFQTGYLTVDKIFKTSGNPEFSLKIPNLEVKTSIIPLLLSLKSIKQPLDAQQNAIKMLNSIIAMDVTGFQDAFGNFLSDFSYSTHESHEAYYHSLFKAAMYLAGEKIDHEVSVGDGKYDASYQAPDGTRFIFEIKYCPFEKTNERTKIGKATASDLNKMNNLAMTALKQIDNQNYTKPYRGLGNKIYKVALVVGGRTEVLVKFEEETA